MWKYLKIYIFIIFYFSRGSVYATAQHIEIKLQENTIKIFFNYTSSDRKKSDRFLVTEDGSNVYIFSCPQTLCFPMGSAYYTNPCSKINNGKKCLIFAVGRKVRLNNYPNMSQYETIFNQKDSLSTVRKKLKKLGFVD